MAEHWNMKYKCRPSLYVVFSQHPYGQDKMNDATQKKDDGGCINFVAQYVWWTDSSWVTEKKPHMWKECNESEVLLRYLVLATTNSNPKHKVNIYIVLDIFTGCVICILYIEKFLMFKFFMTCTNYEYLIHEIDWW